MKLYYVEYKTYFKDRNGYDMQFADGGQMPRLYHTAEKAIGKAKRMADYLVNLQRHQVTLDNNNYPRMTKDVLFATRLENPINGTRYEIRVYEIETRS